MSRPTPPPSDDSQLRLLTEAVTDIAIFLLDPSGHVATWNPGAERIKGYQADEIVGKPYATFFLAADLKSGKPARLLEAAARDGSVRDEGWRVRKDGSVFWAEVVLTALHDGQPRGFAKITRDMTERRQADEALRQSDALFRSVAESVSASLWVLDAAGEKCLYVNRAFETLFHRSCESVYADLNVRLEPVHPADRDAVAEHIRRLAREGEAEVEFRVIGNDGSVRWLRSAGRAVRDQAGRVRRLAGSTEDVTDRKRVEETLSRLVAIVEATDDAIVCKTTDGVITDWNPGAERLYGYTAAEVVGKSARILYPAESQAEFARNLEQVRHGVPVPQYQSRRRRKDGTLIEVLASIAPLLSKPGRVEGVAALTHDLTETLRLQEQFRQAQKMEAVGRLAGGVAHDFNNLLTVVYGYTELLLDMLPADSPMRQFLSVIETAAQQSASLTRQLLAFSRQTVLNPQVVDVNVVVKDTEKLLRRLIGEDILLSTALDPHIGPIKIDPGQLGQVLMNLAVNSRDAMPRGGRLTIETKGVATGGGHGRSVLLSVSDTGQGMTPDTLSRIFEPFFTTKEVGKGTGLGLSVVHGIVKQSNGLVEVASELGVGTTFRIRLPVCEASAAGPAPALKLGDASGGGETVLLVEDEDGVRLLAAHVLREHGYAVLMAANGEEAMQIVERHAGGIDILVTDVVMPGMGGRQLAETLAPRFPSLKVLYSSGYTDDAVVRYDVLHAEVAFLQKPYTPNDMIGKVRQVLSQAEQPR